MTAASLPPVIQAMLQPEFYPHAVVEPIRLIQTHISYVFLTGEFVYKVKKPVNFGFLDFSTLEKRQHFCQEELRLNQRGTRDLYLEVLPITQSEDGYHLNGPETAIEYTVKMRQFPQEALLSDRFDRGQLTEAHMSDLAQVLADFHAKAASNDHIRSYGTVERIRQAFDENYEQTTGYIGGPQTQQQFDETKAYTDRLFAEQAQLLAERVKADKIRECHGDAHLGNIALWNDQLMLFDCIEFNEPFRFVDTMYDVGFIGMDLDARGRSDLANAFLNAYLEQTGDWEGLQVLPLYLSRQAYVRAKVTSFLLNDPAIPEAEKQRAQQVAADYYRLAWRYTQPQEGKLILMSGLSGSGKSTTAQAIARRLNAIHLRSDAVRKHLAGIPIDQRGSDAIYTLEMTQKTYDRLLQLGLLLAQAGYAVILDAKYDRLALRQLVIAQAQAAGIPLQIYYCSAPMQVLQTRVAERQGDITDATVAVLAQQSMEPFTPEEKAWVREIDTTEAIEVQLSQLDLPKQ